MFPNRGYCRIIVTSEEDKKFVDDYLSLDDFEYGYMGQDMILVASKEEIVSGRDFPLVYNGKYEGDLDGLMNLAKSKNILISFHFMHEDESKIYRINSLNSSSILNDEVVKLLNNQLNLNLTIEDVAKTSLINDLEELFRNYNR